ncbi:hypothetical protein [Pseudomonas sp. CGJS7]|uniref:hypothetical protein n=1 Tax=Pseudomonas sp. CGJS7 TaxID=3109348 RepID=UPI0030085F46
MTQPPSPPPCKSWQVDAILVVDPVFHPDGHLQAWAMPPDTTWRDLAPLLSERYDRIAFSSYPKGAFDGGGIMRTLELDSFQQAPETEIGGQYYDLCVCEFSAYTAYLLGQTRFNHWQSDDPDLRSDDLCLLKDGRIELLAQPWRSMLRFFAVEHDLLQRVEAANPRFKGSMFVIENGRFRGI